MTYRCCTCKTVKPLTEFHNSNRTKNGHRCECKSCRKVQSNADWYKNHSQNLVKQRANRAANIEADRASKTRWREKNRVIAREMSEAWRLKNRERKLCVTRNYRAKVKYQGGVHTHEDITRLLIAQAGRCNMCRCELVKYHVDHIFPVSRGGSNDPFNLQLLCPQCNWKKGDKLPDEMRVAA